MELRYLIIGAGGTGGAIAAFMKRAGKDVTLIARGEKRLAIRRKGLRARKDGAEWSVSLPAMTEEEYEELLSGVAPKPDIIFLCTKYYSVEEVYDVLQRAAGEGTIVIPIQNVYGTGEKIARDNPGLHVLNGCMYIAASVEEPGVIRMVSDIFRIFYGEVDGSTGNPLLEKVRKDLEESGITAVYSDNIRRDTLQKFSMVSPNSAAGLYYDCTAQALQREGEPRQMYIECVREIEEIARAMHITFDTDLVETNLKILDSLDPSFTTSLQKDVRLGGRTEIDGQIFEVCRLGRKYYIPVPAYDKAAAKFGFRQ